MTIDWLKDKNTGEKFYPRTHEDAVIDNDNVTLSTKLAAITASIPEDKVFLVTYGTTTATQVIAAISSSKTPICFYNDKCYIYSHLESNYYYFYCVSDKLYWISVYGDTPTWSSGNNSYELSTNKVISLSSGSTDTQYPSAKCVYNAIQAAAGSAGVSSYDELTNRPALSTTATTAQATAASETISGTISLHKVSKTGSYNDLLNKPTIPSAPGTLNTSNATAQATASTEALSGTINLHKVAKTGTYSDLIGTPTIPSVGTLTTTATTAQATATSESFGSAISLHKVSKTGSYSDLLDKPTIPSAPGTLNTNITTALTTASTENLSGNVKLHKIAKTGTYSDLIGKPTTGTSTQFLKGDGSLDSTTYESTSNKVTNLSSGCTDTQYPSAKSVYDAIEFVSGNVVTSYSNLDGKPSLNTTATTAQETSANEEIVNTISLHKVSKTGSYTDLNDKPTIPSAPGTLNTNVTASQATASTEALSGTIKLHKISKTGSYTDLNDKPTLGTASEKDISYFALSAHTHGNITSAGTITADTTVASGMKLVTTNASGYVVRSSVVFGTDTTKALTNGGTWADFIGEAYEIIALGELTGFTASTYNLNDSTYSTIGNIWDSGKIPVINVSIPYITATVAVPVYENTTNSNFYGSLYVGSYLLKVVVTNQVSFEIVTFATASHSHGNLNTSGQLQSTDITIANGDKLVVTDASGSNKIARTSVSFGTDATKALTNAGTWVTFAASDHSHGNITSAGIITGDTAILDGSKLVITDPTENHKIGRSSIYFTSNSSGGTKALSEMGTWEEFSKPPLFIDIYSTNPSTVPAGTYDAALAAIGEGRQVIVRYLDEYTKYFHLAIDYSDIEQYLEFQNLDLNENPQAITIQIDSGDIVMITTSNVGGSDNTKENKLTITTSTATAITATTNTYYRFTSTVNTLSIRLNAPESTYASKIMFSFTTGSSPNISFTRASTSYHIYAQDGYSIEANKKYELYALSDGANWVITSVKIGTTYIV